jgi:hypothetical protein
VNQQTGSRLKLLEVLIYYNFIEILTDEEGDQFLSTKEDLFATNTISLLGGLVGASSHGDDPSSYPKHFYTYMGGDIEMDKTPIETKVKDK